MKRWICLLLTLSMAFVWSAGYAAHYDTLAEKLSRQLEKGSGLRGVIGLSVDGEADWVQLLKPLSGRQLSLRGIVADGSLSYQLYAEEEDDTRFGVTELYGDHQTVYLTSDLLIDTVLSFPNRGDLFSTFATIGNENPAVYSTILALLQMKQSDWNDSWMQLLIPYEEQLDAWIEQYVSEPVILKEDGISTVQLTYTLTPEVVKQEMKALLHLALRDQALLFVFADVMTEEQQAVYLNPANGWYYDLLIDALPLEEDLIYVQCLSALGEKLSTSFTMPLSDATWHKLCIETEGNDEIVSLSLISTDQTIRLTYQQPSNDVIVGEIRTESAEQKLGASFSLEKTSDSYTDEEIRNHEVTEWTLYAEPLPDLEEFQPFSAQLRSHFYSKPADTQATTMEQTLTIMLPDGTLQLAGRFRSTTPWVIEPLSNTSGAKDLAAMTKEERVEIVQDWLANALIVYAMPVEESTASATPTEPATATDLATVTDLANLTDLPVSAEE